MITLASITHDYLTSLIDFLVSISWMFTHLNTQYVRENLLTTHHDFLSLLNAIEVNEFVDLREPQNNHPHELQHLVEAINAFRIDYEVINTENWQCKNPQRRLSLKKSYEIENMSALIAESCGPGVKTLVDLGSGLGYLGERLHTHFGFSVVGLEASESHRARAEKRQARYCPESIGKVRHVQHFVTTSSGPFIETHVDEIEKGPNFGLFGLHPCGDLSIVSMRLFLEMERARRLIISPCCYHKMSAKDEDFNAFNHFPLSEAVREITSKLDFDPFLRPFLRLAGQQSPIKFKEMSREEHFVHGKNMFERAVVEAILDPHETTRRINNVSIVEGRLKYEDITLKYQIVDKNTNECLEWTNEHERRFDDVRTRHPEGEELSENLFCLQTAVQNTCENLVIVDRIFYLREQMLKRNIDLKVSIKKLQNEKLSPRCLIFIVEKS